MLVLIVSSFFPAQFHRQEYLFFALLILAVGVSWFEGQTIWIRTPIDWPIFFLLLWILITVPFAIDQAHSLTEWRKLAGRFLVFYWALLVFQKQPQKDFLVHVGLAVAIGAFIISGYAIWDFIERGGTLMHRGVRAVAPSSHSHWLATYLVMAWPIVFLFLMTAKSVWKRLLLMCILVFISVAEVLSFSRGGWIAIAGQIAFLAFFVGGLRRGIGAALGIVLCAVGIWWISQFGYLGDIFEKKSVIDRLGCWELGIEETAKHPIVGLGFGNDTFAKRFPGDPPGECGIAIKLPAGEHLHNTLLMFAMGSGIPAFVFLLWILVKGVHVLVRGVEFPTVGEEEGFRIAIALVLVGFWVCAFFDYLFSGSLAHLFLILLAGGMFLGWNSGLWEQTKIEYSNMPEQKT